MLDIKLLRTNPDAVETAFRKRGIDMTAQLETWRALDEHRRSVLVQLDALRQRRNNFARAHAAGNRDSVIVVDAIDNRENIVLLEREIASVEEQMADIEMILPNLPHESVPLGADADANRIERVVGEPRTFDFAPKPHWELGADLGILDFRKGVVLAGARFTVLVGDAAKLERALINFMIDMHTREHGYLEMQPPFFANRESLTATGQLPKFKEELFQIAGTSLFAVPTAEVPLTNYHRDEILSESELPKRYTAHTPCFRAEAGSHGRDVRGMIRQHQFDKVELVQITTPETSWDALEKLTRHAEAILLRLELPYRVVSLSTGDLGFASSKTYDLEVWLPGQGRYREISSCSNCVDFQARRGGIRYKPAGGGSPRFVHTLNGSGLAVGRTLIAILENYQQADGTIDIPRALRPYFGADRIRA